MSIDILTLAFDLSDHDLLARLGTLAGHEREVTAELVAHLAALDARPNLYAAHGYGSLFRYCTEALLLTEDATCTRIEVARASRRFPAILGLLSSGALSLAAVRMLSPHLTAANQETVLTRASGRSRREIEAIVAELAPRPDAPTSVRKLPARAVPVTAGPLDSLPPGSSTSSASLSNAPTSSAPTSSFGAAAPIPPTHRPIIETTSPERYRVQFTIGKEGHDRLRRLQELLRREIPNGDPAAIVDRALILLLAQVEKAKLGAAAKPRPIRPGTDSRTRTPIIATRHIPRAMKRAVSKRDGGQCGYVAPDGRRCSERHFLEFHHIRPFAHGGEATVDNIALRCRRHNQYEADLIFGPRAGAALPTAKAHPPGGAARGPAVQAGPGTTSATPV